ncbi:MAG: hypothetical protein J0L55_02905 [Caulobacterales bacterium]|nr:hypothetical protein [Caulobacterales bacterium]MCA0371623.1 hypothetical protein [Pseudomonadota bacterium]
MKQQSKSIIYSLFLSITLFLSSCSIPKIERYKVTLNVEYNGALYSASAVQEIKCTPSNSFWQGMSMGGCDLKGEAIPLQLGANGYLFLILAGKNGGNALEYYYYLTNKADEQRKKGKVWDVNLNEAPMLVTFFDVNDSKTVKRVHFFPHEEIDHYEKYRPFPASQELERPIMKMVQPNSKDYFGETTIIKSIHVERTNEPITWGQIEKVLPWLADIGDNLLDGHYASDGSTLAGNLQKINFIWR